MIYAINIQHTGNYHTRRLALEITYIKMDQKSINIEPAQSNLIIHIQTSKHKETTVGYVQILQNNV